MAESGSGGVQLPSTIIYSWEFAYGGGDCLVADDETNVDGFRRLAVEVNADSNGRAFFSLVRIEFKDVNHMRTRREHGECGRKEFDENMEDEV